MSDIDRSHTAYWRPELLKYIRDYLKLHGYMPTFEEMAVHFEVSKSTIRHHLGRMVRDGYMVRPPDIPRAIRLTERGRKESMKP